MKFLLVSALSVLSLFACNNKSDIPDVSDIKVDVKLERFEKSFFNIDSNNVSPGLLKVRSEFPDFYSDFMQNILGVSGSDRDTTTLTVTKRFLNSYSFFASDLEKKFSNTDNLEREINRGFQYVKYYFPDYKIPKLVTYIGTLDAPGIAMTRNHLAIGLHQFAGKDFEGYQTAEVTQMFPAYIIRRFDAKYVPANCMKAVVDDLFPDKSNGRPLIEQMIEKGKQWWLLDKLMPQMADSLKTGYTQRQLTWCRENEGLIWNYFITNNNLEVIEPDVIQNYIGESPTTQGMPGSSPGNIGQWVGWQIVKKFADKNPSMKPSEIMNVSPRKILVESKYKPK
jgi:hypothetical protein